MGRVVLRTRVKVFARAADAGVVVAEEDVGGRTERTIPLNSVRGR